MTSRSPQLNYYLGCPVWACADWTGSVFRRDARRADWLTQYSQAFNTVEGNSTFYAIPSQDAVARWASDSAPGFRFALKFPQTISHERQLEHCDADLNRFLAVLEILGQADRLGPTFLQLPAQFGPAQLPSLAKFLDGLPPEFPYAVEVRHPGFFAQGPEERAFDDILTQRSIDRVLFDSTILYDGPPTDEHEQESQRRKPHVPVRRTVTGRRPLVRFVGRDDVERSRAGLVGWASTVAAWIDQGLEPYFFTHSPCDAFAPATAQIFHDALRAVRPATPPLPEWPGVAAEARHMKQRELF